MVLDHSLRGRKVAVTGSAGFIGSNLVDALVPQGCSIVGIDDLSTGSIERGTPSSYVFERGDITDLEGMRGLFSGCDIVFHLAALARVSFSIAYPLEANCANITGTLTVLEAARRANVRRVVFGCSGSIFGGVTEFPTPETSRAHPLSPYALQKFAGAEYCRLYSELYGLDTVNLLFYNVFGPHQRADAVYATVIPAFFHAAVTDGTCHIDGDGEQSRDFCYIANVVDALVLAGTSPRVFRGDLINVACGEHYAVNRVFEEVARIVGKTVRKVQAAPRLGDPRRSHADISKAQTLLGYEPRTKFVEGMERTGRWWLAGQPAHWTADM